jgi:hypothetical protein
VSVDAWEAPVGGMPDVFSEVSAQRGLAPPHGSATLAEARGLVGGAGVPDATIAVLPAARLRGTSDCTAEPAAQRIIFCLGSSFP